MTMRFSTSIIRATLLILTSTLLNSPTQANAYWTKVSLRIEGPDTTIFESTINTAGGIVTTLAGGTHMCDGTNNGAESKPCATITSAINDAVFTWDGTWYKRYQDYLITSIGGSSPVPNKYWGLFIGYKYAMMGGCQSKVKEDDKVLVAFDASETSTLLESSASPLSLPSGQSVKFKVVDGRRRSVVQGAKVTTNGGPWGTTDDNGEVTLVFDKAGVYKYKATKDGAIRSNAVTITVTAAGGGDGQAAQTVYVYDAGFRGCN